MFIPMKKYSYILLIFGLVLLAAVIFKFFLRSITPGNRMMTENVISMIPLTDQQPGIMIQLPAPQKDGTMSLERALSLRRSERSYLQVSMRLDEVSQLLWSAQGITNERGFRTAPSAGATFPLEIFLMVNNVEGLSKGIYRYVPFSNELEMIHRNDLSRELEVACLGQTMISQSGIVIIFSAIYERTTQRYGERGIRYVYNEVGHASQNVHLQAAALNLGTVVIGAYRDNEVEQVLALGEEFRVLYLMPVGKI
jgi:SagB-type dehydrogenase family enzyme